MDEETHVEECATCEGETTHKISIEIIEEGENDGVGFSREPYRIAECLECGTGTSQRMNDV
ncbi:DUF7835 family putative zinc beta-ribbon protein [Haladaptatus halobius]|uniref:DUF7835 family putative zinc beta-ribbon protein n=1 Tax=Haladaptatus halobius TaxID=2884875 RepID=UPI001D0B128E|nr:hypothetical protein [Haladaptatus halobius]